MAKFKRNTDVKRSNKLFSKVQKRGECTKTAAKKLNKGASSDNLPKHLRKQRIRNRQLSLAKKKSAFDDPAEVVDASADQVDASDMIEDTDLDYLRRNAKNLTFFRNVISKEENGDEDEENEGTNEYEKVRRTFDEFKDGKRFKNLLPIKGKSGLIPVRMEIAGKEKGSEDEESDGNEAEIEESNMQANDMDILKSLSPKELLYRRRQMLTQMKIRIAQLSDAIIVNPESNLQAQKELVYLLDNDDPLIYGTLQKLVMISALEVFKDIIPGYRIRSLTELELGQKIKKDTKELHSHEERLLENYKLFLKRLESLIEPLTKKKKKKKVDDVTVDGSDGDMKLAEIAVRCLCELLVTHPHFNFRSNIIVTLVPLMAVDNVEVADLCCKTMKTIYKQNKLGDVSVEIVKQTAKLLKARGFDVPSKVLETFLSLKIKDFNPNEDVNARKKSYNLKMSKREIKRKKRLANLETELRETAGEESRKIKIGFQTEIVNQVFATYFRILKKSPISNLLSVVLEGLAKFSHVINVDFFDDLIAVLHGLIDSGDLDYRQNLHCIQAVMTILSGQGEALNIDPLRFYTHLYKNLFALHAGLSSKDIPVVLTCLDIMINKRCKKVSNQRVVAFAKRVCTMSLQQLHDAAIGLLLLARSFFVTHKYVDILLDTDTSQASGVYLPELEEPEYCNANSTSLWELHLLRKHYHPAVRMLAQHLELGAPILGNGQLPQEISRRSAIELYEKYDFYGEQFNPCPPETIPKKKTKFYGKDWTLINNELRSLVNIHTSTGT